MTIKDTVHKSENSSGGLKAGDDQRAPRVRPRSFEEAVAELQIRGASVPQEFAKGEDKVPALAGAADSAAAAAVAAAASAPQERRVGAGGKHPETNMEIAVIARRRVRGMIQVLNDIAREKKTPASARVSAAKAIIDFARLKPDDVRDLTDHDVKELARQIIEGRASSAEEGRALSKAAGVSSRKKDKNTLLQKHQAEIRGAQEAWAAGKAEAKAALKH